MTIFRLVLLIVSVGVAALAGQDAGLAYWRVQDPANAPKFFASDPALNVRLAERYLSNPDQVSSREAEVGRNAIAALRSGPLDATAMRQLGVLAAMKRIDAGMARWQTAERITRRDLPGQFVLIEHSAQTGDLAAALAHYDRSLLVYPEVGRQLYPILARALSSPEIRAALVQYAAGTWVLDFLGKAIDLGADPAAVVESVAKDRKQIPPREAARLDTILIGQLVSRNQFSTVRDLVSQTSGAASRGLDRFAPSPATSNAQLGPLAWTFFASDAVETVPDVSGGLSIKVASERSGMAAQRVTLLAPGRYQFTQTTRYDAASPHAALRWVVNCLGGAAPVAILQQSLPVAAGDATYHATLTVPEGCAAQSWQLVATAEETQFASSAALTSMALVKQ